MRQLLLCSICLALAAVSVHAETSSTSPASATSDASELVQIDGNGPGRIFDGIGGLSAGAASRLLIDYPEPQRSHILDLLFKPRFGASLHDLKVEIGGDMNSTWGAEPSHAVSRDEFDHPLPEYYERGYEWWLMKEARKRNPDIVLESLQWGAPGWIGGGEYFSQDNADFVAGFIKAAQAHHGLTINYQGIRNEAGYKIPWIKMLRQTLDRNGLQAVQLVAADDPGDVEWKIVKDMMADPELSKAVYAAGVHYVPYTTTEAAKTIGKPLWFTEAAMYGQPWGRAKNFARLYNRNYIIGRMTKTIVCTPITSLFENLVPFNVEIWNDPGLMKANSPWSGHYEVPPSVWVTAHTTQFAEPGWRYLDEGCGLLKHAGSYATLRHPGPGGDYSIIIETMNNLPYEQACQNTDAKDDDVAVAPCRIRFAFRNLSSGPLHVWRTNRSRQFEQLTDILPDAGSFSIVLDGNSVYTLSTTTGQRKGAYDIPAQTPFPLPYREDFENATLGRSARFISDQEGCFVTARRENRRGQCLRQIVPRKPIPWFVAVESPWTLAGDKAWRDYEVSADVHIVDKGFAGVYGRIDSAMSRYMPGGYGLILDHAGTWWLKDTIFVLKSGTIAVQPGSWHALKLRFNGVSITAEIDGQVVCSVADDFHATGAVALASSYSSVEFDNLKVEPLADGRPGPAAGLRNIALGKKIAASSQSGQGSEPDKAVDGNHQTGWSPAPGKTVNEWIEVDFGQDTKFDSVLLDQHVLGFGYSGGITEYKIQCWDNNTWKDLAAGKNMAMRHAEDFAPVFSRRLRLLLTACSDKVCVYELKVYCRQGARNNSSRTATPLNSARQLADDLPCVGRFFEVEGRPAFLLMPLKKADRPAIPWVWYAPTFAMHPDPSHAWMFRQFLEHGIAIAGVDVGESFGNPQGRAVYSALYEKLRRDDGLAERACLLPQSRGGLMLYNWAAQNAIRVAGIAGIYTVCDMRSYPGLANACGAFGMDEPTLSAHLAEHNPIDRLRPLAEAGVPILHIHGDSDNVVPLERNSGELAARYRALGGSMRLIVVPGKGHQVAPEFFQRQELVDFVIAQANGAAARSAVPATEPSQPAR